MGELYKELFEISEAVKQLESEKSQAYWERNQLVLYLSKQFQSHLCRHPESDIRWDKDWRWIVCIHLPEGQATWHIHESEIAEFNHLKEETSHWDGHTTLDKYNRLKNRFLISKIINQVCMCGHEKRDHIYEDGACRPGYICQSRCGKYEEKKNV